MHSICLQNASLHHADAMASGDGDRGVDETRYRLMEMGIRVRVEEDVLHTLAVYTGTGRGGWAQP